MFQNVGRGIAHDQMKGVIDEGLAIGAGMVVVHGRLQTVSLELASKGDHRGGAAAGSRPCAGEKVVGHSGVVGGGLIQVAVRVHTTGGHQLALGVDVVLTRRQVLTDRHDLSIQDANVGRVTIAGRGDVRVSNDGVE